MGRAAAAPRLLYLTSSFPYGANDLFFEPEVRELVRQGVDVRPVPIRPRGPLTTADVESLSLRRPLFDLGIATAALAETLRAPVAVASTFALLFRSPRPNVLARNLASFPKALWVARLARSWKANHIHAHWAGPAVDRRPYSLEDLGRAVELHGALQRHRSKQPATREVGVCSVRPVHRRGNDGPGT